MNIEIGQYINDGQRDLLVSAIEEYNGKLYIYLIDEINDVSDFYEIDKENDVYNFKRIDDEPLIQQLIIHFSDLKKYVGGDISED